MVKRIRMIVDICMTLGLLCCVAYLLIGEQAHERIGSTLFILFVAHHILNRGWIRSVFRGKYSPLRIYMTAVNALLLVGMVSSMVSGILISKYLYAELPFSGHAAFARVLHMLAGYWNFALISLHIGMHWSMMLRKTDRADGQKHARLKTFCMRLAGALVAAYGLYAFIKRQLWAYMLLRSQFVFFDVDEPFVFFYADYLAIMGLFIWIGHYSTQALKSIKPRAKKASA